MPTTENVERLASEVDVLRSQVQALVTLEQRRQQRMRVAVRAAAMAATLLVIGYATVVVAAPSVSLTCPGGQLFCFTAGAPAKADEINHNFAQVKAWLEAKVGTVGSGVAGAPGTASIQTSATLATTAPRAVSGGNSSGNLHLDSDKTGVDGKMYLNWFDGKGVVIGNSAQAALMSMVPGTPNTVSITGDLSVSGKVNAHKVPYVVSKACTSGSPNSSCSVTCSSGDVIRQGWGFHGSDATTATINFASWGCGSALTWLGSCLGQNGCTVGPTGCTSSSIWVECW